MKNNLKKRRIELGLTQAQVAQAVAIAESSYQRYERAATLPIVDMAIRIARVLDTTVEELFVLEEGD